MYIYIKYCALCGLNQNVNSIQNVYPLICSTSCKKLLCNMFANVCVSCAHTVPHRNTKFLILSYIYCCINSYTNARIHLTQEIARNKH